MSYTYLPTPHGLFAAGAAGTDELFDKALASVRRMAQDYAATQTTPLRDELAQCRSQVNDLRAALIFLANDHDGTLCWCATPVCVNQPGCENTRRVLANTNPPPPAPQRSAARP